MIPLRQVVSSILGLAVNSSGSVRRGYANFLMNLVHNGAVPKDRETIVTMIASRLQESDVTTATMWAQQLPEN